MSVRLLGGNTEGSVVNAFAKGRVYAFKSQANDTGETTKVVYHTGTGAAGTATSVRVGIYSDEGGKPGTLLGEALVEGNGREAEHTYETTVAVAVAKGTSYWIAILAIGGTVRFKLIEATEAEKVQRSSSTEVATLAAATGWASVTNVGSTVFLEAVGIVVLERATLAGGGAPQASVSTTRAVPSATLGGGGAPIAVTPVPKGVKSAVLVGGGAPRVISQSRRNVASALLAGGGSPQVVQPVYGLSQVYAYGDPSIWRVVEPLKAAAPGSPIIIYLHESSKDEPSELEAPNKLPRVGESLAETAANKRQLSCVGFAENAVENGFACFVPAYHPISAGYPSANNDIDALIAWVKQHAEAWNGDPSKVCIIGGSFGVLYGFHEALRLNSEKGSRYIAAVAGLSGPIDIPSRVKGRDEEVAAKEAWEAAHPGFTAKELEEWEAEHNFATTDIVQKLANYLNVSGANLKEVGWLEGPSAEQKAALKLAEELSPFYNLATMSATMPYLWYAVSKADLTPQQQGEEMNEAAALHGQPGKYHFNASIPSGHSYAFYSSVRSEIYAYFRQALSPPTVGVATLAGGGRPVAKVSSNRVATLGGGGSPRAVVSTTRKVVRATLGGGGRPVVRVKPKEPQPPNTPTRATVISYRTRATIFSNSTRAAIKTGRSRAAIQDRRTQATIHGG